jgi:hypothetical protein
MSDKYVYEGKDFSKYDEAKWMTTRDIADMLCDLANVDSATIRDEVDTAILDIQDMAEGWNTSMKVLYNVLIRVVEHNGR